MLMPWLTIWLEMATICSLRIAQEGTIGGIKIQAEEAHFIHKGLRIRTGRLQVVDQEWRCLPSPMGPTTSTAHEL